jgi:hypothetical protein
MNCPTRVAHGGDVTESRRRMTKNKWCRLNEDRLVLFLLQMLFFHFSNNK